MTNFIKKYEKLHPRIEKSPLRKLIGLRQTMSVTHNKTGELWQQFMPRRREIQNRSTSDVISVNLYGKEYFTEFEPGNEFVKWAAAEVTAITDVPPEMSTLEIPSGLYAVFNYKGLSTDNSIYQYIFGVWLPDSDYRLDHRPHYEILGEKYRNNDPNSEEEIWIPVKEK
ncbi:MAG: GyrI-like domain-containing protein [Flavobacteriaceae bacterium]|nr:GyrI-like domain-containing protein [Muriicola sp.]NNL39247.1 GyrI-like domain-containing protein [Flavobacteriaceae bacterium]